MKLLITGGRDFTDYALFNRTLNEIDKATPITTIMHGACPSGASR